MNAINRVEEQPAYILYSRPFRENSLLLEAFSRDYGRVSLIAQGVRRMTSYAKARSISRSRCQSVLQPFMPLLLSWHGRGELFNLSQTESNGTPLLLEGPLLASGWYMNELLVRTLRHWDVYTQIFDRYALALSELSINISVSLRQFEKTLLTALGVMPQLNYERQTRRAVKPEQWYQLNPETGVALVKSTDTSAKNAFQGALLLAVECNNFQNQADRSSIRRLFRLMLDHVLEGRTIRSRDLL